MPRHTAPEFTPTSNPDIYFIVISDNLISTTMYEISRKSWMEQWQGKANFYRHEATVPKTIPEGDAIVPLNFGRKAPMSEFRSWRDFSPGEMASWYSHARLWQKCIETNRPTIVLEHDCFLERPMSTRDIYSHEMVCFSTMHGGDDPDIRCGNGYYITPYAAKQLIELRSTKIDHNLDAWVMKCCDNLGEYKYFARHINHEDGANTCDHPHTALDSEFDQR